MAKTEKEIRWHRLDNTANIFPVISNEHLSSVYRIGVVLREEIDPGLLYEALQHMLPWFEGMQVRLRRGVFWYYFETNPKAPVLTEEALYPCRYIEPYSSNQYLFRVSYFKNKINVEIFHALTDGYGAINFLKELTAQYLHLRYPDKLPPLKGGMGEKTSLQVEDSYEKYYVKEGTKGYGGVVAYELKDEVLPLGVMGVTHGFLDIPSLKGVCQEYGVSITQYLAAVLVYSIYQVYKPEVLKAGELGHGEREEERRKKGRLDKHKVRINIPVNLRQFFPSETTMNFFGVVFAEMKLSEGKVYSFEEILEQVAEHFSRQLTKEHMEELIAYNVSNEKSWLLRPIPLFLKNMGIKLVYSRTSKAFTTTLSNLGFIRMLPQYEPFVESFHFIMGASPKQPFKCVVCSYGKQLVFTISSAFSNNDLQTAFFRKLKEDGVALRVEGNGVYPEEQPGKIPYPRQPRDEERYRIWTKGYFVASVLLGGILTFLNFFTYRGVPWSLVSTGAIVYFLFTMRFSVHHNTNPAAKIMIQTLAAQVFCLLADVSLGYSGWSVNYAIPALLLLANGMNLILTAVNHMSWQSYLLFQIEYVVLGLIPMVLRLLGVITRPALTRAALLSSVGILSVSLLLGDKKAKAELKRRFHM
ncbi:MAG: MFS transporter [Lachnospiraceae bacterium]|nr:MFS transporter [Lachnospiraceae bacterium]